MEKPSVLVYVIAVPNAKKDSIDIVWKTLYGHDQLKVKTTEQAIDGKANIAIKKQLAKYYELPNTKVVLKHWHTAREKVFIIW